MNACTIIARNYLAHARVLAESFLEHHSDGTFTTLLLDDVDREVDGTRERFQIVHVTEIGIEEPELHRMAMIYDVLEFATAVKPWFLRTLLDAGMDHISYFDPDIQIFAPLTDIAEFARAHSIVLTPHVTEPLPRDGLEPSERTILRAGMFNLGFIAVGREAREFLDWWSVRLRRDSLVDPAEGQFVDQRWVDFVPSLFDHYALRDPGCNVATWNLASRDITWKGTGYVVSGHPLRFYHFSGFLPESPNLLSKFQGDTPRILLSERRDLARLCREYAEALMVNGYADWSRKPYFWNTLPGGTRIDRALRRRYRHALIDAERRNDEMPPDPFDPTIADAFEAWSRAMLGPPARAKLSQYARALYDVDPDASLARLARAVRDRRRARRAAPQLRLPRARSSGEGANVVGYFRAELGIGEAARQIVAAFERVEIPFTTVTYDKTQSRQEHPFVADGAGTLFDINVVCVNADQTSAFRRDVGQEFFRNRYSIGVWFWEIAEFPESLHAAFSAIDEVWVASDFVRDAIAGATSKPVLTMPLPVRFPDPPDLAREELALPEGYLFLFSFDFLSVFERKNPLGVLDAFTRAFRPGEGPVLLLKSINGDRRVHEVERLQAAAEGRPDILVRDGYLSVEKKNALTASCDCYVSLHRSEGFGLTMAEAMAYGKPVIATAYSGNLAFMTEANSYLVPYRLGRIPAGCDPYPADVEWAEPDIDEAARLLRRVWEEREEGSERGRAARVSIERERSLERMGQWAAERLGEIRREYGMLRRRKPLVAEMGARVRDVRRSARRAAAAPSGRPAPVAAQADGSPLERARTFLSQGPTNAWRAPSPRLGSMGVLSRRVLHRILQPYIIRQRELETAVVEALIEADENSHAQSETFDALRTQVQALGAQLDARGAELDAVLAELTAVPYAADPALLRTRGRDGEDQIGYRDGDGAAEGAGVYRGFEEIFRGSEDFIRERQRPYLDLLARHAPILDVGCGRGEFLDLLAEADVACRGIDIDPAMVVRSREKGHDVELAEACEYLSTLSDASLGAVFSAQVIEHLHYEALVSFFALSREKVAPGGLFVAETVNPHSIQAFKAFWVDPTHRGPIFPEVAVALCRLHGYSEARVVFPNGTGDLERDRRTQGEYAVVATR